MNRERALGLAAAVLAGGVVTALVAYALRRRGAGAPSTADAPPTPAQPPSQPRPTPSPPATEAQSHAKATTHYLAMIARGPLPSAAQSHDSSRATALYFAVHGLELLGALDAVLAGERRRAVVEWIYANQAASGGFAGSPFAPRSVRAGHVVATYSSLATLLALGDDLSRVDRAALTRWLRRLQHQGAGCFRATEEEGGGEADLRFAYAACACSFMLGDWSGVDADACARFAGACRNADGGFGLVPGAETHGGALYTAVASLTLLGKLRECLPAEADVRSLARLCAEMQSGEDGGFCGRLAKPSDVCYGFWVGASLAMLGRAHVVNRDALRRFTRASAHAIGGFSKTRDEMPDPLHTYFGLWCDAVLCRVAAPDPIAAALGVSERTSRRLAVLLMGRGAR